MGDPTRETSTEPLTPTPAERADDVQGYGAAAPAVPAVSPDVVEALADKLVNFRAELAPTEQAAFDRLLRQAVPKAGEAEVEAHAWFGGGINLGRLGAALGLSSGEMDRMFGEASVRVSRRALLGGALGVAALVALDQTGTSAAGLTETRGSTTTAAPLPSVQFATAARHNLTGAEYQAEFDRQGAQGFRLVQVSGYDVGGQPRFAAIWEKTPGPGWIARHGLTAAQYQTEFDSRTKQGYRPVVVNGYGVGNQVFYAAIFELTDGFEYSARHGLSDADYAAEFRRMDGLGFRLRHVSGYAVSGRAQYAAIWDKSPGPQLYTQHAMTAAQYQTEFNQRGAQGYRLTHVCGYTLNNADMYAAIWAKGDGPDWSARHGLNAGDYQTAFTQITGQGNRPADVSGYSGGGDPHFAALWQRQTLDDNDTPTVDAIVAKYMAGSSTPGVSLAVARRGALAFAKAYGVADQSTGERLTTNHRFRIASVSKPITSAAIFTLVEAGRLRLSDTVFGTKGVLGTKYGKTPYGTGIESITINHLLHHTGGGWTNDGHDPMFSNPTMSQAELIGWTLDNRPLDHTPGTSYAYSNFGYCVLGRVIEQITGQGYADYARQSVLSRAGISDMVIAGNTLSDRQSNEVVYYGGSPYTMQVARMDSHGGWIATPADILRFALRVDGFTSIADLLRNDTINTMTTASSANAGYACGWAINDVRTRWHNGALDGTSSILVRTNHEFIWCAIANRRDIDLDSMMWEVYKAVAVWPSQDLF